MLSIAFTRIVATAAAVAIQDSPPARSGLDRDERVLVYSTAASLDESGKHWRVPVSLCVFEPELDDTKRAIALSPLRSLLSFRAGTDEARRFEERTRLFMVDHERGERVNVAIGELAFRLGPTLSNGCFETTLEVPVELASSLAQDGRLPIAIGGEDDPTSARGVAWLVPPEGISVVSDIDDTIKVTGIGSKREALANTFLREFRAIPGMAGMFARIARGESSVAFHYVSLSPWQLATPLEEFLAREGFPGGSLHLQPFRMQDGDFGDLVGDSRAKKKAAIEPLFAMWPKRRFVLVGDSSQFDPEVFGEFARSHPGRVELILIRDPSWIERDEADQDPEPATSEDAAANRYAVAFAGLPADSWRVFADPDVVRSR